MLVEVDLMMLLIERILISKKNKENLTEFEFFLEINYEMLPSYCTICSTIVHEEADWKLKKGG